MNELTATNFALIRHATTEWNKLKRIQGRLDSILAPEGEEQARQWAEALSARQATSRFDRILVSSQGRAMQTANILNENLGLPLQTDQRLAEQDWGEWCGMTLNDIWASDRKRIEAQIDRGWDFNPPGGESRLDVFHRASEALREAAAETPGQTILVVTHMGVIFYLFVHLQGLEYSPQQPELRTPGALHWLVYRHDVSGIRDTASNTGTGTGSGTGSISDIGDTGIGIGSGPQGLQVERIKDIL